MKRITSSLLALLLALSMLIGMVPAVYAADNTDTIESIGSTETADSSETEEVPAEPEEVAVYAAELTNYVTLELVYGASVPADVVTAAKALYEGKQYETAKAANEAFMALYGVGWVQREDGTSYLNVTDNTAPLYAYAADADAVAEVKYYVHGTLAGFTSLVSDGNNIDCTVGGNHQIPRTSITITGVDNADGSKAQLTDGNVQAYVAGGYASKFRTSGKLTIDNIEFTSTTSTTVGASASADANATQTVSSAEMEIKNCVFRGRLYVYDNFPNEGKMTYNIHDNAFDGTNYSGDSNAYPIFAQCRGGDNLIIKNNEISGFARGINIDHANITATIEGNKISITDSGRSCIQLSSLAKAEIKNNTITLNGGNALTLHAKLLTMTTTPEITVTGNTITGNGYLIYDDAVANEKAFTSENLTFTFNSTNNVVETVNTKAGKKGKEYGLSTIVDNTVNGTSTTGVATVGTTTYNTLEEAIDALSEDCYTLKLLDESKWDTATPVYWEAGMQSDYAAKLTDALTAAYKVGADNIKIVCRPGADVGKLTHGHVADNITIYGNKAYISDGECDLEVDTFKFSRQTGAQADNGEYLTKNIAITAYGLDNLGVWGERHTTYTVGVTLIDCDGKTIADKANVQRVYISGTTGVNDITLTDCDFITNNTSVYSNADGAIFISGCSFTGSKVPVNFNHKADGSQNPSVLNCTFENCGDKGEWNQFAAPVRFVNSGSGVQSALVNGCTFNATVGSNGDILLGDGRTGQESNNVILRVVNTNATVKAQKPGYYIGEATDTSKGAEKTVTSSEAMTITIDGLVKDASTETSIDLDTFLKWFEDNGYTVDGASYTANANAVVDGKLVVKWSPVSGCYDQGRTHECTVNNVVATGNTPKRLNSGLLQFQLLEGQSHAVTVKNVKFVYEPADVTVCINSNWKGTFTADEAPAGQLYFMTTGDVTFENCDFEKTVLTTFNTTGNTTVKNCSFKDVYNSYAIKDIRGENITVTGTTIENCGGGIMVSSTGKVTNVNITNNKFTNVDAAGTAPDNKVKTRAILQIASSGNYADTAYTITGNTATNCGPALRQLNESAKARIKALEGSLKDQFGADLYTGDSKQLTAAAKIGEAEYETLDAAITAVKDGETITVNAGEYKLNGSLNYTGKAFTIKAADDAKVSFNMSAAVALHGAKITFENVTFDYKTNGDYIGLQHTDTLVYNKCTINGKVFLYAASETFNECTFNQTVEDYNVWTYGAKKVAFNKCTFNCKGKAVNVYIEAGNASKEPQTIEVTDVTVNSEKANKAFLNIKNSTQAYDVIFSGTNTVNGLAADKTTGSNLYQVEQPTITETSGNPVTIKQKQEDGTFKTVYEVKASTADGTEEHPYTLADLSKMTRAEYIAAQERLGGTMYVTVDDYSYETNGVLGNGERNDTTGQIPDHSKLNAYGENGYLGEKNDGANGKNIVFVGGKITSGVTGYESIDNIGTSLLLAVPAYTNVTFKGTEFNNVMSFNYQLYTSPWSQLGELKFDGCTFNGIIVGAIAAQTLTFDKCEFNNYTNTVSANSSNPTWIRPAYGNWTKGDNEGQGNDFRSLTKINFTNCKVTSTRPVKFERIAQWEMDTTVTATGNTFDIFAQDGDTSTKNVGMYFGANAKFDLIADDNKAERTTAGLYTGVYSAPDGNSYAGLPAGSTVKDLTGKDVELDALEWKSDKELTLKTTEELASVKNTKGTVVNFASLSDAIAAAKDGDTVKLLTDTTEDVVIDKNITLDLGGKTLTNTNAGKATLTVASGANAVVKNGSIVGGTSYYNIQIQNNGVASFEDLTATAGNQGSSMIDNYGDLTITSGTYTGGLNTIKNECAGVLHISGGSFTLTTGSSGYTGVIYNYGKAYIFGGDFTQAATTPLKWAYPYVILTGYSVGESTEQPTTEITDGTFTQNHTNVSNTLWAQGKATSDSFAVSGGTFNKTFNADFCVPGKEPVKNADGLYEIGQRYDAKIGSTKYETIEKALANAEDGDTVTLLHNVTVTDQIVIEKQIKLVLDGKKLISTYAIPSGVTSGDARYAIVNKAALEVKGSGYIVADSARVIGAYAGLTLNDVTVTSALDGGHACVALCANGANYVITKGRLEGDYALACFADDANVNITRTTINGRQCGIYQNGTNKNLTMTVTNATINGSLSNTDTSGGKDPAGVYISGNKDSGSLHNVTFTGCTINGSTAIEVKYTNLTLDNCTVTATCKTPSYVQNSNGMTALGFAVVNTDNTTTAGVAPVPAGEITIKGSKGKYTGLIGLGSLDSMKTDYPTFEDKTINVSAGTFDHAIPEDYCADGYIPQDNGNGSYGVVEKPDVAQIGDVKYKSLQAAIDAAKSGNTIQLIANTNENVTISKKLTLDLNGFTLNGEQVKASPALKVDNAAVTVMDSSEAQTGTIMREDNAENSGKTSHYVIDIQGKNGFLKFEGGNVVNNSGNDAAKGASLIRLGDDSVSAWPTLTIKGGKFTQNNFIAIKVDRGTLYFKDGEINSANSFAIENWNNASIQGGTVNGTVSTWVYSNGAAFSKLEISGGTVNGNVASVNYDSAADKQARIYITGGNVTGTLGTYTYSNGLVPTDETAMATVEVTSGTFAIDPSKYVVEDSTVKKNEDGTFGVEKAYLAKVGDTSYYTMDEAFKAAKDGETITMLRDYTTDKLQNSGSKSYTIDLNKFTWTYTRTDAENAAFEINYPDVTLTVKNGKVISNTMLGLIPTAKSMNGTITYNNAGLVFEGVEATANGHSGIETNGGNTNDSVTLRNSTLNVPSGYGIYFPSSGTLTIENSTINAKTMGVQICAGSLKISGEDTAITVNGDAVSKTENDGAIEDGAAISIVNRKGYKGLVDVTITEGTFKANGNNAAVKAYDWENNTAADFTESSKVSISGGRFSTAVPEDLCKVGYKPAKELIDGLYTVEVRNENAYYTDGDTVVYGNLDDLLKRTDLAGKTITLIKDVDYSSVVFLMSDVTLDLNGQTLNALALFGTLGDVIDSKDGEGLLKLTAGAKGLSVDEDNSYLPLYDNTADASGYRFFSYRMAVMGVRKNSGSATFALTVVFNNSRAYKLLSSGAHEAKVYIAVEINGGEQQLIAMRQSTINDWATVAMKPNANTEKCGVWITITGITTQTIVAKICVMTHGFNVLSDATVTNN